MAAGPNNLMDPPIEGLLDRVDSKFTLVALGAKRARQVNSYYNSLGDSLGRVVPPQVTSVSGKPLSIAFEEIAAGKATYSRLDPNAVVEADAEVAAEADADADAEASPSPEAADAWAAAVDTGLAEAPALPEDEGPAAS
jgi:DNA-directed RNA polymerase subunit omega